MLPVLLQLARPGPEFKGRILRDAARQPRQAGRGLVVGPIEGGAKGRIARQHRIGGAAPDLGLAHEVERMPDHGEPPHFIAGGADRSRRIAQHHIHRAA
ncbi:hypothetical protein D3C72_2224080 [compost metagenome]